ncbi:MAG: DUF4129 domain-containing protein [Armatimonadota bacterium]
MTQAKGRLKAVRQIAFVALTLTILLTACSCAMSAKGTAPYSNSTLISRQIRQILSQPEYNRVYSKSTTPAWLKKYTDKVKRAIQRIFRWLTRSLSLRSERAGRLTSFVFACIVILAFFALTALIISRISRRIKGSAGQPLERAAGEYEIPSSRPLISQATKLADAGDWRGAFRCVYLASISHLDETGALHFERSRTNWEYLRELDKNGFPSLRDQLRPLTVDFDRKFYGREGCDKDDYLNALAVYERIKGEAAA